MTVIIIIVITLLQGIDLFCNAGVPNTDSFRYRFMLLFDYVIRVDAIHFDLLHLPFARFHLPNHSHSVTEYC
jgi:hypothetical protein